MGNFTFRRVISFFVLSLLCIGSAKADDEGYYIVGPQASKGAAFFNEYLKMQQSAEDPNVYSIAIPARYPIKNLLRNKDSNKTALEQYQELFTENGLRFLVAKKPIIEKVIKQNQLYATLIAPSTEECTSNSNCWVSTQDEVSGKLADWNADYSTDLSNFEPTKQMWEIRKNCDVTADVIRSDEYPITYFHNWTVEYKCWRLADTYKPLDGSYIFSINVKDKTWTMKYQEKRVAYLAITEPYYIYSNDGTGGKSGQINVATKTYTFEQSKVNGKYSNIYSNPAVYYNYSDKRYRYVYLSNYTSTSYSIHRDITTAYNRLSGSEKTLDNSMRTFSDFSTEECYSNYLAEFGPSDKISDDNDPFEGYRHPLWGSGSAANELSLTFKGTYPVLWYPSLGGGVDVNKWGEYIEKGNNAGMLKYGNEESGIDIPDFNYLAICPGTRNSALKKTFEFQYDDTYGTYVARIPASDFGNGSFYFEDTYDQETLDELKKYFGETAYNKMVKKRTWSEDADVNVDPTDANPNSNKLDVAGVKHVDNYYAGPTLKENSDEVYLIKLYMSLGGVCYYSISTAKGEMMAIPSLAGENIRTFSSSKKAYVVPDGCTVYVVTNCEGKDGKLVATLEKLSYIPKNTGVIVEDGNGTETKYVTLTEKDNADSYQGTNYLVPTVTGTLNASDYYANLITARNYFLGTWSNCTIYDKTTDYVGFFRVMDGSSIHNNKAYLKVPIALIDADIKTSKLWNDPEVDAKGIQFIYDDSDVTGISEIQTTSKASTDDAYYTLTGTKVVNPSKGIYIHHGKTMVIK